MTFSRRDMLGGIFFCGGAVVASVGATIGRNNQTEVGQGRERALDLLPERVEQWRYEPSRNDMVDPVVIDVSFALALELYDRIAARDYASNILPRIMLNVSYKRTIRQEERFHWPELCYAAQGFHVTKLAPMEMRIGSSAVGVARFLGTRQDRLELVHYVMRIGERTPVGSLAVRNAIFLDALSKEIPDGTLFRTSLILDRNDETSIQRGSANLSRFMQSLCLSSPTALKNLLV